VELPRGAGPGTQHPRPRNMIESYLVAERDSLRPSGTGRSLITAMGSGRGGRLSNAYFRSLGLPSLVGSVSNRSNRRVRTRTHDGVAGVGG
jgi:hypothetical protein